MSFPNASHPTQTPESQTLLGIYDDRALTRHLVDLRPLTDDRTVLKNPHKGWFWHYIDNGFGRDNYRVEHPEGDWLEDFPALNHLYLRYDWGDVETAPGVYDFSRLDEIMDKWGAHGYTFSMRLVTYEADDALAFATPRYVFERGAKCFPIPGRGVQPDYGDPIYLERLEAFLEAAAAKYNGDPRIEIIDIGTFGTWGEGHTACGDGVIWPADVVKHHLDLSAKYFPDTFLLCNDDHIMSRMAHGQEEIDDMLDYAISRGFGLQDDSICCCGYAQLGDYDTMRARWAFERLGEHAPNCVELEHYCTVGFEPAALPRGGFTIAEALKNARATFAGFHGYPRRWITRERNLAEYAGSRLGYWFFLPYAVIPPLQNTASNAITLHMENHGWAKSYWKSDLRIRLSGPNGTKTITAADADLRRIPAGGAADLKIRLDLRGLPEGDYDVSVGVTDVLTGRPVLLALKNPDPDGFVTIARTHVAGI